MKHDTLIDGLHFDAGPRSEVIAPSLLRYDLGPGMIDAFFRDLGQPDWLNRLKARAELEVRDGLPLADQAVHRKAVIVVVDAACLRPGFPRLDPAKVESAGLVIRRERQAGIERWMSDAEGRPSGWTLPTDDAPDPATETVPHGPAATGTTAKATPFEPDAGRRRARLVGRNRVLAAKPVLAGDADGFSEETHPMFPIPPDIAAGIGRTLYFAVLPTTSATVEPAAPPEPPFSVDDVAARIPALLQVAPTAPLPAEGAPITRAQFRAATGDKATDPVAGLRSALTWLAQETGAFTGEPYAAPLRREIENIALESAASDLFTWLDRAHRRLVEGQGPTSITAPDAWPAIDGASFARIRDAAYQAMAARWGRLAPAINRFGEIRARYHVCCFLRIDDCRPCPPRILWSPVSASYRVRPWYESGGAPPQQVELPPLDADALKKLRPDVAVKVPPELQQFMDRLNMDALLEGEAKSTTVSLGMICGFSIPIITICAFIILQLFLALLNILFFWLPFVKICIPYPIVEEE